MRKSYRTSTSPISTEPVRLQNTGVHFSPGLLLLITSCECPFSTELFEAVLHSSALENLLSKWIFAYHSESFNGLPKPINMASMEYQLTVPV